MKLKIHNLNWVTINIFVDSCILLLDKTKIPKSTLQYNNKGDNIQK